MTRRTTLLSLLTSLGTLIAVPAHGQGRQATDPADHNAHHPAGPAAQPPAPATPATGGMTSPAKLGELLNKMNSAEGEAKTAAMAELLTALVRDRQACEPMMANMMKMMERK